MKKILFISPRNPFSGRYSGDVIRAKKFIYFLSRNNYVKVISLDTQSSRKKESKLNYEGFDHPNFVRQSSSFQNYQLQVYEQDLLCFDKKLPIL